MDRWWQRETEEKKMEAWRRESGDKLLSREAIRWTRVAVAQDRKTENKKVNNRKRAVLTLLLQQLLFKSCENPKHRHWQKNNKKQTGCPGSLMIRLKTTELQYPWLTSQWPKTGATFPFSPHLWQHHNQIKYSDKTHVKLCSRPTSSSQT